MAKKKEIIPLDKTTEEKIKSAARTMFIKKGFAATRTREIAEEAGINLALLNYYFRSKEKLFNLILKETIFEFVQNIALIMNDESSSLEKKVELFTMNYIDFITNEPDIPIFMSSEIRNNSDKLYDMFSAFKISANSVFFQQYSQAVNDGKIAEPNPIHFLLNMLSLIIFPFIGKPLLQKFGAMDNTQFAMLMQERKKLIPVWINLMFS